GELRLVGIFAQPLALTLTPSPLYDEGFDANVRQGVCTASPTGGVGPFTYKWAKVSGDPIVIVGSDTSAAVTLQSPVLAAGQSVSAVFECTCTDSVGQTAVASVTVSFRFYNPFS